MPELPEVETVCRELSPILTGRRVTSIQILDKKLAHISGSELCGREVARVFRSGKQVVFDLSSSEPLFILVHLRMTGTFLWYGETVTDTGKTLLHPTSNGEHPRLTIHFEGGELHFCDTRRFGTVEICHSTEEIAPPGLEPLGDEFTPESFLSLVKNSKQSAKQFLLRQDRITGIGNIYASEILFDARVSPRRQVKTLTRREAERIVVSTKKILALAVERAGTTFSDFKRTAGELGGYQELLKVYERGGEECRVCRTSIRRIVQQQRSTYYCPTCQKK